MFRFRVHSEYTKQVGLLNLSSLVTVSVALSRPRAAKAKLRGKSYECKATRFVWKFFDGKRARNRRAGVCRAVETLSMERGGERSLWNCGARVVRPYHRATAERTSVAPL